MNSRTLACVLGVALIAGVATAQSTQAVEWKVSEGGNGHWYGLLGRGGCWSSRKLQAEGLRGHLATVTSSGEMYFVQSIAPSYFYLGGYRLYPIPPGDPQNGWRWVTQELVPMDLRCTGEPPANELWITGGPEANCLGDSDECANYWYIIEWDADCNGDGIVDYGQILRGELEDLNSNGVPDICETSIVSVLPPSVPAQGGSTITIRGNGFPANPTVLIGGVPATNVVRESLTRITATSPAVLPGMASVSVNDFTLADGIYIRPECGSDLDQNGIVDAGDISIILLDFGQCYETPYTSPTPDVPPLLEAQPLPESPRRR
jgi:hypothetical protein